jgi:ribonucleotide monophosphatase NagD (HAD superfamily)
MMAASTGRRPDVIIGKPNSPIVHALIEKTGIPVQGMCMVGDRLYTDIALGQTGLATVLVMSGETRPEDLPDSPFKPDLIMRDLAALLETLRAENAA